MRYKMILLLLISAVLFSGCTSSTEDDEETGVTVDSTDESLEGLWTEFHENMPDDRNMEDDFRNSWFISELKNYLSGSEGFEISEQGLRDKTGINDISIIEKECGSWKARTIFLGADLYNKAVTDVSVKNKYVFLQMSNGEENYFKTVYDGDFVYPQDMLLFENNGRCFAVIISKYCAAYPEGVLFAGYTVSEGSIVSADLFDMYELEGVSVSEKDGGVLFESSYEEGTSFGDISRLNVYADNETNGITLVLGEDNIYFGFNGEKYIADRSE
jgi:hypothetical protein